MRPPAAVAALTVPLLSAVAVSLAGCSQGGATDVVDQGKPADSSAVEQSHGAGKSEQAASAKPRTAVEFLARAKEAMSGEKGWTFAVKGSEELVLRGQKSTALYTATVHRTTGESWALHSAGTTYSKGVGRPEEIFVVDGTGYVKEGGPEAAWKHGPLTDPEIADKVEDPVAALNAFQEYATEETTDSAISLIKSGDQVELQVRTSSAALSGVRERAVVKKAVRELKPTLKQLRAAGVTASESQITVENVVESVVLDASTYRINAHIFRCAFLIPYDGRSIRYSQGVTESNQGTFAGTIALPAGAK